MKGRSLRFETLRLRVFSHIRRDAPCRAGQVSLSEGGVSRALAQVASGSTGIGNASVADDLIRTGVRTRPHPAYGGGDPQRNKGSSLPRVTLTVSCLVGAIRQKNSNASLTEEECQSRVAWPSARQDRRRPRLCNKVQGIEEDAEQCVLENAAETGRTTTR